MKNVRPLVRSAILLSATFALTAQVHPSGVEGNWLGAIEAGGVKLRIAFHISRSPEGTLRGTFDSLDQNARGLPLGAVVFEGKVLHLELKVPPASYTGTLNEDGTEVTGTFTQGGFSAPLNLRRSSGEIEARKRPQEPKPPFPYHSEDVTYPSKASGVQLAGTLTTPESGGPFAAVLLITGSGAQDRDEALLGHKPFLVIADYLTRHGIAVLRVDDRGTAKSTGTFATATTQDFVEDAAGSVAWLETRKEIDPKHIGLIGHSEGAIIAPMLAVRDPKIAFVVMMAGTAVPGEEVLKAQAAAVMKASGATDVQIAQNAAIQKSIFDMLHESKGTAPTEEQIRATVDGVLQQVPEASRAAGRPTLEAQVRGASSPWFRYFLTFDPSTVLRQLKTPVLVMNGSLDRQVVASQNLPVIAKDLEDAGNSDYEIVKLSNLNHLFQTAKTGAVSEYSEIEETVAPIALETMANWIARHSK